ncbi:hypothetical protein FRC15_009686, partial [Serendipita sp. 397]
CRFPIPHTYTTHGRSHQHLLPLQSPSFSHQSPSKSNGSHRGTLWQTNVPMAFQEASRFSSITWTVSRTTCSANLSRTAI